MVKVGDKVWLPDWLRGGLIPALAEAVNAQPGRVVAISGDLAQVDYGAWGQFGCLVDELTPAEPTRQS